MLSMFTESIFNASLGIFMPKWSRTIYEPLSAPLSPLELVIAYVGAAATKSMILGLVIFATAHLFVDVTVAHPLAMIGFMALIAVSFSLFGDRKSTRLTPVTNAHLVCRLLLEKKKIQE